jgi:hypothetical protein
VVDGNSLLFVAACVLLAIAWRLYGRVRPDDRHTTRSVLQGMLTPALWRRVFAGRKCERGAA